MSPLRRLLVGAVLALSAGTLSACATPTDSASPVTVPAGSPTASAADVPAADPLARVTLVVVRPLALELLDASGDVVTTLSYDSEAGDLVHALSTVFDASPEIEDLPGSCCESGPVTRFSWPGFTVVDDHMGYFVDDTTWVDDDGPDTRGMNVMVSITAPSVGEIAIEAASGFSVGDDASVLREATVWAVPEIGYVEHVIETGPDIGPSAIDGEPNAYSVVHQSSDVMDGPRITAPYNTGTGRV